MRIFVAVAKRGSFAEAARQLRISASVATRSIAHLEDHLGLTLLTRTTRSLRLTERGLIYLENAQQILEDLDGAERRVRGESAEPRGELKVAAPVVFGRLHVLPIVIRALGEHRALSIRLNLSDRNVHLIDEGIDVAIRIGELANSSLIAVRLGAVGRVLVASPEYLKERGAPNAPADLSRHDIVAFENIDATNEWRFAADEPPVRVEPRLAVNSADAAIAAAEAGMGITRTLTYQVDSAVRSGRLIPILQRYMPPEVPVGAVYPARRIASANVAAFVKAARKHFTENPITAADAWPVTKPPGA
ncbi:MAG TPA: LysR family transcriptional regulator [Acetobacteraceae bacterium]|jgi:DNA-binding transcriptional LysR family regulator|nr:LysR family transcriptional regulator [Acetobacteraceae bacterium]